MARDKRERDEAAAAKAKHARSEAPTLPPPPTSGGPALSAAAKSEAPTLPPPPLAREEADDASAKARPMTSGTFKVSKETVATNRRDPRREE
jgi:hypothetical protein